MKSKETFTNEHVLVFMKFDSNILTSFTLQPCYRYLISAENFLKCRSAREKDLNLVTYIAFNFSQFV